MIRHFIKLVFRRKRQNALLVTEIFVSFLVVFFVVTFGLHLMGNYGRPLGFGTDDVYRASFQMAVWDTKDKALAMQRAGAMLKAVQAVPEVESAALISIPPYFMGRQQSGDTIGGRYVTIMENDATDDLPQTLGMKIVKGRWFSREDDGVTGEARVVVNEPLAKVYFPGEDPIGRLVPETKESKEEKRLPMRIVGVIDDFRHGGELSASEPYRFERTNLSSTQARAPGAIVARVRRGTSRDVEEKLAKALATEAKDWSVEVMPVSELRASSLRLATVPLISLGVVAGFLILMVALGLTGVLWQNVTRRTSEIGLRRAIGATAGAIHFQVLGEIGVMTAFGIALGAVVVAQVPLLSLLGPVDPGLYATGFLAATLVLLPIALLTGLYPSRFATRVAPVEALRYE